MSRPDAPSRPCNATVAGKRCAFKGTQVELADHATEFEHWLCSCCSRSLRNDEPATCDACVQRCRDDLRLIAETFTLLPEVVEASGYHSLAIDALALSADGSLQSPQRPDGYTHPVESVATAHIERPEIPGKSQTVTYWRRDAAGEPEQRTLIVSTTHPAFVEERKMLIDQATGLRSPYGREHVKDHWPTDPAAVIACLEHNERDWRHEFGHGPAVELASVESCARYLLTWLQLAARTHPAFSEFATEIRSLAVTLEHVTGIADDPVIAGGHKEPIRCFDCGTGRLVRMYRPPVQEVVQPRRGLDAEGLPDEFDCDHCGSIYDTASYYLAVRAALEADAAAAELQVAG